MQNGKSNGLDIGHRPAVVHQMVILFNETTGEMGVQGVPPSKVTALGMLKLAGHLIANMNQEGVRNSPIVQVPPGARLG
jgi:hypothetical protein